MSKKPKFITRDISWLSFNARVLQEAADTNVHIHDRLRFLGIFSNNLDEFFRVRVATLSRMARLSKTIQTEFDDTPAKTLEEIQDIVIKQQEEFDRIYADVMDELSKKNIHLLKETQLDEAQQKFVKDYFEEKVRTAIVPLMIESIPHSPVLNDQSIYLACVMGNTVVSSLQRYSLIEVRANILPRFTILPSEEGRHDLILLEDIIRYNLPALFSSFGFNRFLSHVIKITRDAELDFDNEQKQNSIEELEKGLKKRRIGRATRFVFDKNIDINLLRFITKKLGMSRKDNLIPGGRIHNFKDFMDFPRSVFSRLPNLQKPIVHTKLIQPCRIMEVIEQEDVMLHFPYHSFDSVVDLLREAAIDPFVHEIKITAYRLAKDSKIINALINAARNGKEVSVILELRARFDEENNLFWKERLEEEGVKVFVGIPNMKIHAKLILIKKKEFNKHKIYALIATGNINENTARFYGDHALLTSNKKLTVDIAKIFETIESHHPVLENLKQCKELLVSPYTMRSKFMDYLQTEIDEAQQKRPASVTIKLNSLVDKKLIEKLYEAANVGVQVRLIIRGICCAFTEHPYLKDNLKAISIVDEYLEHARLFHFHNKGNNVFIISSADWMVRNLDHRIEVATPIYQASIKEELNDILNIQWADNTKARILNNQQNNRYKMKVAGELPVRSQKDIFKYIESKA